MARYPLPNAKWPDLKSRVAGSGQHPPGTEIVIPDHKMKWDRGNPTGHNVIFLSNPAADGRRDVYCFVDGTGV